MEFPRSRKPDKRAGPRRTSPEAIEQSNTERGPAMRVGFAGVGAAFRKPLSPPCVFPFNFYVWTVNALRPFDFSTHFHSRVQPISPRPTTLNLWTSTRLANRGRGISLARQKRSALRASSRDPHLRLPADKQGRRQTPSSAVKIVDKLRLC